MENKRNVRLSQDPLRNIPRPASAAVVLHVISRYLEEPLPRACILRCWSASPWKAEAVRLMRPREELSESILKDASGQPSAGGAVRRSESSRWTDRLLDTEKLRSCQKCALPPSQAPRIHATPGLSLSIDAEAAGGCAERLGQGGPSPSGSCCGSRCA